MNAEQEALFFERIASTPVVEAPFPHQYLCPAFPEAVYDTLLEGLPATADYVAVADTGTINRREAYRERLVVNLAKVAARSDASQAWRGIAASILSPRFQQLLLECFRPWIMQRFGDGTVLETTSQARLVRDLTNYALGPHTDAPNKLLSLLFYLPRDDTRPHLGTSLYAPLDPAFRCPGGPHHPFDRFRRLATMPYRRNALFIFFKNDVAFHGVEPVREQAIERDAIQYNIYVVKTGAQAAVGA